MHQLKKLFIILTVLVFSAAGSKAEERIFKWSFQSDAFSLEPYVLIDTFTKGFLNNVYESLANYDDKLQITPALAESWEHISPKKWIFHLRKGVKFHNGNSFTAEDVVFSWKRAKQPDSNMKYDAEIISNIKIIDDYTIEVSTAEPSPILVNEISALFMMDKEWSEANNVQDVAKLEGGGS